MLDRCGLRAGQAIVLPCRRKAMLLCCLLPKVGIGARQQAECLLQDVSYFTSKTTQVGYSLAVLKLGCVLAGMARTQRLGRVGLHVAAASTQSARFAARGGTPVPKNSVLIVGATGTLGGLQTRF